MTGIECIGLTEQITGPCFFTLRKCHGTDEDSSPDRRPARENREKKLRRTSDARLLILTQELEFTNFQHSSEYKFSGPHLTIVTGEFDSAIFLKYETDRWKRPDCKICHIIYDGSFTYSCGDCQSFTSITTYYPGDWFFQL